MRMNVKDMDHRKIVDGSYWEKIPAYKEISTETFRDYKWQSKQSITKPSKLLDVLKGLVSDDFIEDVSQGFARAPMSLRISPHLLSLIDWSNPYDDPLRIQFIPVASRLREDHPELRFDSLKEQSDSPVPGLTHRYPDKALFLALDTCPVYCRFCTRSYAVGIDTDQVEKIQLKVNADRWDKAFEYIQSQPQLEDIVVSGGDAYNLRAEQILQIGHALLSLDNIRRFRFATKGPAVMPQKILSDHAWTDALIAISDRGRQLGKEVVLHTHFNNPNEITSISQEAMLLLFQRGLTVRNQAVLQRGVNDASETMALLIKRLGYLNVHPYYIYMHDLVKGVEDLRTPLSTGLRLEKQMRGITAGFNTPTFVVDAPGGGGKRAIHSFEHYNIETGISVYSAPSVKPGLFLYYDPIYSLSQSIQNDWGNASKRQAMIDDALDVAHKNIDRY